MPQHTFFLHAFREAAPYIHYLRGKTLVIGIASALLHHNSIITALAADFNLLAALGVRLVLVHGSHHALNQICQQQNYPSYFHQQHRITDTTILQFAKQVCGEIQFNLQAALSLGTTNARLRTITGNYIFAQPMGIIDGIDMCYTGRVRKVDHVAIHRALQDDAIVLISPLGTSPIGQSYSLAMNDVASAIAIALHAEKLIFLIEQDGILTQDNTLQNNLNAQQAQQLIAQNRIYPPQLPLLQTALEAVEKGISRVQILSGSRDGDLLRELFTRHGAGTSIAQAPFTNIRPATEHDIAAILALIAPLEQKGILIHRSQHYLAEHINDFSVLENDRQIEGCVALKTFPSAAHAAELACLVVANQNRNDGYGKALLTHIINQARAAGKHQLFALSTHTSDWFLERGFQAATFADLPAERQTEYQNSQRHSKIFVLSLESTPCRQNKHF